MDLKAGATLELHTDEDVEGNVGDDGIGKVACSYTKLPSAVSVGSSLIIDNGALTLEVTEVHDKHVACVCKNAYKVGENAIIRVPGAVLDMSPITEQN